jgi:predicted transcriptional regulator
MKEIKIELDDNLVSKLESRASELGVALDAFLAQAISQNAGRLVRPNATVVQSNAIR